MLALFCYEKLALLYFDTNVFSEPWGTFLTTKVLFLKIKFIYSEKATKFCEIFTLLLTTVNTVKCKVKISQNFVAFSEYMNFNLKILQCLAGDYQV